MAKDDEDRPPPTLNRHLADRLEGIRGVLVAQGRASGGMSSASKGREREMFVDEFLSLVFPAHFRFGTGDITDSHSRKSGQVDVVVELPFFPSFPVSRGPRLYLAEGVAAAIEVKSDLSAQWAEVKTTTAAVKSLAVERIRALWIGKNLPAHIPVFAVGYRGYKTANGLAERLDSTEEAARPDGILVLEDPGLFMGPAEDPNLYEVSYGAEALFQFLARLNWLCTKLISAGFQASAYMPPDLKT